MTSEDTYQAVPQAALAEEFKSLVQATKMLLLDKKHMSQDDARTLVAYLIGRLGATRYAIADQNIRAEISPHTANNELRQMAESSLRCVLQTVIRKVNEKTGEWKEEDVAGLWMVIALLGGGMGAKLTRDNKAPCKVGWEWCPKEDVASGKQSDHIVKVD